MLRSQWWDKYMQSPPPPTTIEHQVGIGTVFMGYYSHNFGMVLYGEALYSVWNNKKRISKRRFKWWIGIVLVKGQKTLLYDITVLIRFLFSKIY